VVAQKAFRSAAKKKRQWRWKKSMRACSEVREGESSGTTVRGERSADLARLDGSIATSGVKPLFRLVKTF
jgi:hypothetical protein